MASLNPSNPHKPRDVHSGNFQSGKEFEEWQNKVRATQEVIRRHFQMGGGFPKNSEREETEMKVGDELKKILSVPEDIRVAALMELVKGQTKAVINNIEKYNLSNASRFAIAERCCQFDTMMTFIAIRAFSLDEAQLMRIADQCLEIDLEGFLRGLSFFPIQVEKVHVLLAKRCAQKNGALTAKYIANFNLPDEKTREEIAFLCAKNGGGSEICRSVASFKLTDQTVLVKLAEESMRDDPNVFISSFSKFNIKAEGDRIRLAKMCAALNGYITIRRLPRFEIHSTEAIREIFLIALKENSEVVVQELCVLAVIDSIPFEEAVALKSLVPLAQNDVSEKALTRALVDLESWVKKITGMEEASQKLKMTLQIIQVSENKKNAILKAAQALLLIYYRNGNNIAKEAMKRELVTAVFNLYSSYLWADCLNMLSNIQVYDLEEDLGQRPVFSGYPWSKTLLIPLLKLKEEGVDVEMFIRYLENKKKLLYDLPKFVLFLQVLILLAKDESISPKEKGGILQKITALEPGKETVSMQRLLLLLRAGQSIALKDFSKSWKEQAEAVLSEVFHLNREYSLEGCEKFFSEWRGHIKGTLPLILVYGIGLCQLKDNRVLQCFGTFVNSLFDGTFHERRYSLTENAHLREIANGQRGKEILDKWKRGLSKDEEIQEQGRQKEIFTIEETDNPEDLFLCGTEVQKSCQYVPGNPKLNQGLLGYACHGGTRIIVVKNQHGKIVARAIFRLVLDTQGTPVLFLEPMYINHSNAIAQQKFINDMAKSKAKTLGVPLTTFSEEGSLYGSDLHVKWGFAPEYFDSMERLVPDGTGTIKGAKIVPL